MHPQESEVHLGYTDTAQGTKFYKEVLENSNAR